MISVQSVTLTYICILSNLAYLLLTAGTSPRLLLVMRDESASMAASYVVGKCVSASSAITVLFSIGRRASDEISLTPKATMSKKQLMKHFVS